MDQGQAPKRGLSALLASTIRNQPATASPAAQADGVSLAEVPVSAIRPNPSQPRTHFDEEALNELAASIKAQGVIQPLVVRKLRPEETTGEHTYELIAGERRWRAAKMAGLSTVPAVMKTVFNERDILLVSLVENLQRADLDPLEEAFAYDRLGKLFGLTHERIAEAVGKSRAAVTNAIRLLELPTSVQEAIKNKLLSTGHALILLAIPDQKIRAQLAAKAQAENMTVRDLERLVSWRQNAPRLPAQQERKKGSHRTRMASADLQEAERRLREHFGTRVVIEEGLRKGLVIIEFYSLDDFTRITKLMGME
ncbi:MAG: ParB/RepB/Spo0J family partition protein [Planctomycetota bacterium]|nr:ParB/RepB/Spo0J family partition protein [Planctomycetota bacterium]